MKQVLQRRTSAYKATALNISTWCTTLGLEPGYFISLVSEVKGPTLQPLWYGRFSKLFFSKLWKLFFLSKIAASALHSDTSEGHVGLFLWAPPWELRGSHV